MTSADFIEKVSGAAVFSKGWLPRRPQCSTSVAPIFPGLPISEV